MKQTFVVPIYQNDPNNYLTHVVRSPLNSKRIARVYAQSLNGNDIFTDNDLIGISIEDSVILPKDFPITAICAQYSQKEFKYLTALSTDKGYLLPNEKAIEINGFCSGSKVIIDYKTNVSDFVLVFECDDEPIIEQFNYYIHNIALSYGDRLRGGLEDRYSKVNFNIQLPYKPISFVARPVIYGDGVTAINYYHIFKETYLKRVSLNTPFCTFYEYLLMGLISIETGDSKQRIDNLHIPIAFPSAKLQFEDSEMGIESESKNLLGFIQFYKTQANSLTEDTPAPYGEFYFESAGYQLIIKTKKQ